MRFVWAVAAFVLAAVMIGAGIAQRTVFQGPPTEVATVTIDQDAPYTLIDGAVLNSMPGAQTLRVQGAGTLFAAYGRAGDVEAWVSDADFNEVSLDGDGAITTDFVAAPADTTEDPDAEEVAEDSATPDAEEPGRNPVGSDLWLDEFQQEDLLIAPLQLPETMSVIIASDGTAPAPSTITITWPIANATPWAGPLMVAGAIVMAIGVFLYFLGIRHARRARGPRRKGLPVPVTEPIDLSIEQQEKGVISAGSKTRREISRGSRAFIAIPAVAVSALLFAGCSADSWPQFAQSPTPSPTATVIVPEGQQQPAVTEAQAERILTRVSQTVAEADENRDAALAATRLEGIVLEERKTNYKLRGAISEYEALASIPDKPLEITLPQAYDGWPRMFMAVVNSTSDNTASIMYLTQTDPWAEYKLTYVANLEAATTMPDLAPAYIGATAVPPDSSFLLLPPNQLAIAYSDVLNKGDDSEYAALFEADGDQFRTSIEADRKKRLEEFNKTGAKTAKLTFASSPGTEDPLALATLESGAIIAINLYETDTVVPTNKDAVIKLPGNATVKELAGASQSATGFTTTFSDQLFFYVPSQGSAEKIQLLGYGSNILDAKVIKK